MTYSCTEIIPSSSLASERVLSPVVPLLFEEGLGHVFLRDQLLIHVLCLALFPREESSLFLRFVSTLGPVIQELPPHPHFLKKPCAPVLKASC